MRVYLSIVLRFLTLSKSAFAIDTDLILSTANSNVCHFLTIFLDESAKNDWTKLKVLAKEKSLKIVHLSKIKNYVDESKSLNILWNFSNAKSLTNFYKCASAFKGFTLLFDHKDIAKNTIDLTELRIDSRIIIASKINHETYEYEIATAYGTKGNFASETIKFHRKRGKIWSLGIWNKTNVEKINLQIIPEMRNDFLGSYISMGVIGDYDTKSSLTATYITNLSDVTGRGALTGFFSSLSGTLNYRLFIHQGQISPNWRAQSSPWMVRGDDEEWIKMWDSLLENATDGIISMVTMTSERAKKISYLHSLMSSRYQIYMRNAGQSSVSWLALLAPLSYDVWIAIMVWIAIGAITLTVASTAAERAGLNTNWNPRESLLFFYRSMCQQGPDRIPKVWSCRLIIFSAYLASAVLMPSYSASLVSYITQDKESRPFQFLEDLIQGRWKILVQSNTSLEYLFKDSKDELFQKLLPKVERYDKIDEAVKKVCDSYDSYALIDGEFHMEKIWKDKIPTYCYLVSLKKPLQIYHESNAFVKNSPYVPAFKYQILRYRESGLLHRHMNHLWKHPRAPRPSSFKDVRIENLLQTFIALSACFAFSLLVLLCEKFVYIFNKP